MSKPHCALGGTTCDAGRPVISGGISSDNATSTAWSRPLATPKLRTAVDPTQTRPKSRSAVVGVTCASSAAESRAEQWRISAWVVGRGLNFSCTSLLASSAVAAALFRPPPFWIQSGSAKPSGSGGGGGSSRGWRARSTPLGSLGSRPESAAVRRAASRSTRPSRFFVQSRKYCTYFFAFASENCFCSRSFSSSMAAYFDSRTVPSARIVDWPSNDEKSFR
mmetsp:Transcript_11910/g.31302  ORF Transcript_11910/g.31302 Transcript_11910/m.31302 type:complete len:221 (-) Transcript_11910:660-1322(-)